MTLSLMPTDSDFTSAAQALVRLQEMYGKEADFTGSNNGEHDDALTGLALVFSLLPLSL